MHYRRVTFFILIFFGMNFYVPSAYGMEDFEYENRLYNIYLKYYKQPVVYGDWSSAIRNINSNSYQLKHKDTLWDLSGDILKDHLYWSKLWVVNRHITNPHRISKGDSIKWEAKDLVAVNDSENSVDILSQFKDVQIPEITRKPVLTDDTIPPSLSYIKKISLRALDEKIIVPTVKKSKNTQALLPCFLSDDPISPVGEVVRKNGLGSYTLNGEQIILDIKGETPQVDSIYTLVSNKGSLDLLNTKGEEIIIKGEVRIVSFITTSNSLYIGEVVKSIDLIQEGDLILPGPVPRYSTSLKSSIGNQEGRIIGYAQFFNESISLNSFIYLDKGKEDGVLPGNIYYVRATADNHRDDELPYLQPIVGTIKIAHSGLNSSTAVVIQLKGNIYKDDFFGGSEMQKFLENAEIINPDPISNDELEEQELQEEEFMDEEDFELEEQEVQEQELMDDGDSDLEEIESDELVTEEAEEEEGEEEEAEEEEEEEAEEEEEEEEEEEAVGTDQESLEEDIRKEFEEFEDMEEIENEHSQTDS